MGDNEGRNTGQQESAKKPENQEPQEAQPPVSPPVDLPPAPPDARHEEDDGDDKIKRSDKIMIAATIVIAIGTLVSAAAIVLQWREMVSGSTATDKLVGYAKVQANSASDQTDAAQQFSDTAEDINGRMSDAVDQLSAAANSAKSSIKATQDAMRLDQRAWLGFGDAKFTITVTELSAGFTAKNVGKSPATRVKSNIAWVGKLKGEMFTIKDIVYSHRDMENGTAFPSQTFEAENSLAKPVPAYQSVFVEELQKGDRFLYVFGKLEYRDVFGLPHWTHYCVVVNDDLKGNHSCDIYNDSDSDHQK